MRGVLQAAERGLLPDPVIRAGIRLLCRRRKAQDCPDDPAEALRRKWRHVELLRSSPVAVHTDKANEQHYELPPAFFDAHLGRHRKYSACYWPDGVTDLDTAAHRSLEQVCERARLADGQDVLELGCGWGSLTLHAAERYPASRITALSNSVGQRRFIEAQCAARGIANVRVITCDINDFDAAAAGFDRVVSIEMLEHVRNYDALFSRVRTWLRPGGLFFVHVFAHRSVPYFFETESEDDWMGRHFFTGGQMPSADLLLYFAEGFRVAGHWLLDGTHYGKTSNAWLVQLDQARERVMPILRDVYGPADAAMWFQRWRIFYMAVAELFDFDAGREWVVAHHLFEKPA